MHTNRMTLALMVVFVLGVSLHICNGAAAEDKPQPEVKGDPYPLETCPVTGAQLGSMGKPAVRVFDGREVRFCCKACTKTFEAQKAEMLKKIDEQIVAQQRAHYPLTHCVVMPDDALDKDGIKSVDYVYNNRLVRLCCKDCVGDFLKKPEAYLKKLDEAVIAQQKDSYPLDTDVVTGEKLGDKPLDRVFGVMLVRFNNEESVEKYKADPLTYNAKLIDAWKAKNPDHEHSEANPKSEPKTPAEKDPHAGHDHP